MTINLGIKLLILVIFVSVIAYFYSDPDYRQRLKEKKEAVKHEMKVNYENSIKKTKGYKVEEIEKNLYYISIDVSERDKLSIYYKNKGDIIKKNHTTIHIINNAIESFSSNREIIWSIPRMGTTRMIGVYIKVKS